MPTCLACHHTEAERWAEAQDEEYCTTDERFVYYRCNRCGALFIDPVPRERLSLIYPPNYYSFDDHVSGSLVFKIKDWLDQRFFKRFIAKLPQAHIRVLDVGGGNGGQLDSLRKVDARINRTVIADLDERAGETARQRGHEYFCGRFEDYHSEEPFEIILMLNLIEHVDNPQELLVKARSLLAPQGIVMIKTPNTDSIDARIFRHNNWGGYHCPRHWILFNEANFKTLVEGTGLRISYFKYTQGAPFWTASILYALGRRKWINISSARPAPKHPLYTPLSIVFAGLDLLRGWTSKTSQMLIILTSA